MATQTDKEQDKQYNPAEEDWAKNVEQQIHALPEVDEGIASKEGAVEQVRVRLRQGEEAASEAKATKDVAQGERQPNLYAGGKVQGVAKSLIQGRIKKWMYVGIPSGIISIALAMGAFVTGSFISLKEMAFDFFTKNHYSAYSKRTPKLQKRIFREPDTNCTRSIRCKLKQGVSDSEIRKYQRAGWDMDIGEKDGKKWIKSAKVTGVDGKITTINLQNFEQEYNRNLRVKQGAWAISKPKALTYRGIRAVQKIVNDLRIDRSKLHTSKKDFRKYIYSGGKQRVSVDTDAADDEQSQEAKDRLQGADEEIQKAADEERAALEASDYEKGPTIKPSIDNLDLDISKAPSVGKTVGDSVRGGIMGALSVMDRACGFYQILRTTTIGAKIYKYRALILYAASFVTAADALKTGDGNYEVVALMAGILIKPSIEQSSLGKTAANSNLYSMITEGGKVQSKQGLGFGVMGESILNFGLATKRALENMGANRTTCRHVQSWYGQGFLLTSGLVLTILTGGGNILLGFATAFVASAAFQYMLAYAIPYLIQYAAGTSAPDPDHPAGGYIAGEAIGAGLGGLANEIGKAGGLRPLTNADSKVVAQETSQEMAVMNQIEREGKSPFDPSVPNSITNKFALALLPYAVAPTSPVSYQNLAAIVASPFTIVGNAVNQLFTKKAGAQSVNYGGQYCADSEMLEMGIVVDANCNPIRGELAANLEVAPETVMDYMIEKGHVDEEDGGAKSDEFTKFMASCVEGTHPMTPDGGGIDVADNSIDTRMCRETSKNDDFRGQRVSRELFFWRYVMDQNILDSMKAAAEDNLGVAGGDTEDTGQVGPLNPGAFVWPVVPAASTTITSCMNETDTSFRMHTGTDIAAPTGTDIVAVADGEVIYETKNDGIYGYYLAIRHANGSVTGYGHNLENLKHEGDTVTQGDIIARVGSRGNSTGPHLHINYIPKGDSAMGTRTNTANILYGGLMAVPPGVTDEAGCTKPPKLKPR